MPFKAGNNKGAGRPKGSSNKVNQNVKDMLQSIYDGNLANIQTDLDLMTPKDKWATLNKMSDKFLPSLKSIDAKIEGETTHTLGFNIAYDESELIDDTEDIEEIEE
tara:strand:+ start:540 stop:857 length:318 start_codon:yes stop_codon:yes gene_type:complete